MGCANCGAQRWQTAGNAVVGGTHICTAAIVQWMAADPGNPDLSIMGLTATQMSKTLHWSDCTCVHTCAEDPPTACSLSGEWHVHPGDPCPVHPDAPGDR